VVVSHTKRGGGEILEERIWGEFEGELIRVLPKKIYQKQTKKVTNP